MFWKYILNIGYCLIFCLGIKQYLLLYGGMNILDVIRDSGM